MTTSLHSVDRAPSDPKRVLDAVAHEIRERGLDGILAAFYLPRLGVIRIAGAGAALEDGVPTQGVDYTADAAAVALIRGHLDAFAARRATSLR